MASEERTASAFTFVRRSRSAISVEIGGPIKIRFVWYQSRPRGLCGTLTCSVASRTPLRTRRNSFCCSPTMRKCAWSPPRWAGGGRRKAKSLTALLGAFCAEEFSMTEVGTEGGDGCPSSCSIRFFLSTLFTSKPLRHRLRSALPGGRAGCRCLPAVRGHSPPTRASSQCSRPWPKRHVHHTIQHRALARAPVSMIGQSHDVQLCQLGDDLIREFLANPILSDNGGNLR